ncbi:MAG: TetR/AcrR family transcriptional regulator, partial [Acidimicrobiales bacterium]
AQGRSETPRARGERTRERVADSLIALLEQGKNPPTAREIAARAGVSVRLVFHHFEDMDALYRKVVALQFERHWQLVREVPADLPLDDRIDRTVHQRARLFDSVREVRRAARAAAIRWPEIAARLEESDGFSRQWLEDTFEPELSAAGRSRRELLAALDAAASWESWDRMRRAGGLSAAAARRSMARALHGLLAA